MKMTDERIEISLNKQRLILLLISASAFLGIGIWFVSNPKFFNSGLISNPTIVSGIGMLSIAVFGLSSYVVVKKLMDKQAGLIIDSSGITDNSSGLAAGHIPWTEVKEIKTSKLLNKKFVSIVLNKPANPKAGQKKQGKGEDNQTIHLSNNTLQCSFEELEDSLKKAFDKSKTR